MNGMTFRNRIEYGILLRAQVGMPPQIRVGPMITTGELAGQLDEVTDTVINEIACAALRYLRRFSTVAITVGPA